MMTSYGGIKFKLVLVLLINSFLQPLIAKNVLVKMATANFSNESKLVQLKYLKKKIPKLLKNELDQLFVYKKLINLQAQQKINNFNLGKQSQDQFYKAWLVAHQYKIDYLIFGNIGYDSEFKEITFQTYILLHEKLAVRRLPIAQVEIKNKNFRNINLKDVLATVVEEIYRIATGQKNTGKTGALDEDIAETIPIKFPKTLSPTDKKKLGIKSDQTKNWQQRAWFANGNFSYSKFSSGSGNNIYNAVKNFDIGLMLRINSNILSGFEINLSPVTANKVNQFGLLFTSLTATSQFYYRITNWFNISLIPQIGLYFSLLNDKRTRTSSIVNKEKAYGLNPMVAIQSKFQFIFWQKVSLDLGYRYRLLFDKNRNGTRNHSFYGIFIGATLGI